MRNTRKNFCEDEIENCDACGRIVPPFHKQNDKNRTDHMHQGGGVVCKPCQEWAMQNNLRCDRCSGTLGYGNYHEKCVCNPGNKFTRSGKHGGKETICSVSN